MYISDSNCFMESNVFKNILFSIYDSGNSTVELFFIKLKNFNFLLSSGFCILTKLFSWPILYPFGTLLRFLNPLDP